MIIQPTQIGNSGAVQGLVRPDTDPISVQEYKNVLYFVEQIINNLDEYAIEELFSGKEQDVEKVLEAIAQEAYQVFTLNLSTYDRTAADYLDKLGSVLEETLRIESYNYFKTNCISDFSQEWYNIEWGNMIQMFPRLGFLASRGVGKSWEMSYAYPLWNLYRFKRDSVTLQQPLEIKKSFWGMIITNKYTLSKDWVKKIKTEVETNDLLKEKIYPTNKETWGVEELTTKNGARLTIGAAGQTLRGPHPSWIVLDDFLDRSVLYSYEASEKSKEVFDGEIMPMLLPYGQILVVGTPFTEKDLYVKLKGDKKFKMFEYPAIYPNGELLSNRLHYQYLMEQREALGTMIFSREYLVKPISDQTSIFPYSILNNAFIGTDQVTLVDSAAVFPIKMKDIVVGVDFAISGSISADYTVATVWGVDQLENYWLMHVWRKRGASFNEQISQIQRINAYFHPSSIVFETNGFQRVMAELGKESGLNNIESFNTTSWNKKDLYQGLPSMSALFERGQIKFPRGDENSKRITDLMCSEFNSVTFNEDNGKLESVGQHDDTTMSSFLAIQKLREKKQQQTGFYWI